MQLAVVFLMKVLSILGLQVHILGQILKAELYMFFCQIEYIRMPVIEV